MIFFGSMKVVGTIAAMRRPEGVSASSSRPSVAKSAGSITKSSCLTFSDNRRSGFRAHTLTEFDSDTSLQVQPELRFPVSRTSVDSLLYRSSRPAHLPFWSTATTPSAVYRIAPGPQAIRQLFSLRKSPFWHQSIVAPNPDPVPIPPIGITPHAVSVRLDFVAYL